MGKTRETDGKNMENKGNSDDAACYCRGIILLLSRCRGEKTKDLRTFLLSFYNVLTGILQCFWTVPANGLTPQRSCSTTFLHHDDPHIIHILSTYCTTRLRRHWAWDVDSIRTVRGRCVDSLRTVCGRSGFRAVGRLLVEHACSVNVFGERYLLYPAVLALNHPQSAPIVNVT